MDFRQSIREPGLVLSRVLARLGRRSRLFPELPPCSTAAALGKILGKDTVTLKTHAAASWFRAQRVTGDRGHSRRIRIKDNPGALTQELESLGVPPLESRLSALGLASAAGIDMGRSWHLVWAGESGSPDEAYLLLPISDERIGDLRAL